MWGLLPVVPAVSRRYAGTFTRRCGGGLVFAESGNFGNDVKVSEAARRLGEPLSGTRLTNLVTYIGRYLLRFRNGQIFL